MYRRDVEGDLALPSIGEIEQALQQRRFVEVGPLLAGRGLLDARAGIATEVVVMAKTGFGQQIVDNEAAIAAKRFLRLGEQMIRTRLAAVEASDGRRCPHQRRPR